jgi:hypothetical protein
MVYVDVDDRHSRHAAAERRGGGNGNVVVEAKAHGPVRLGVMPRRTHERERGFAGRDGVLDSLHGRSRRQPRDGFGVGGRKRIRIQHECAPGGSLDAIEVLCRVRPRQLRTRRRTRGGNPAVLLHPPRGHGIEDMRALRPFGMPGGRNVIFKSRG